MHRRQLVARQLAKPWRHPLLRSLSPLPHRVRRHWQTPSSLPLQSMLGVAMMVVLCVVACAPSAPPAKVALQPQATANTKVALPAVTAVAPAAQTGALISHTSTATASLVVCPFRPRELEKVAVAPAVVPAVVAVGILSSASKQTSASGCGSEASGSAGASSWSRCR